MSDIIQDELTEEELKLCNQMANQIAKMLIDAEKTSGVKMVQDAPRPPIIITETDQKENIEAQEDLHDEPE